MPRDPIDDAIAVLRAAGDDPRVARFVSEAHRTRKKLRKRTRAAASKGADRALDEATTRAQSVPMGAEIAGAPRGIRRRERGCYVCKGAFREVAQHHHLLCPGCAAREREKRAVRADLRGRRALVTGGRVKIGFELVRLLLRDGAHVTVTTRFPKDAARRFASLPEFDEIRGRLSVVALDLLRPRDVVAFAEALRRAGEPLDLLVHNAAQTIRRPPAFEAAWRDAERSPLPPHLDRLVLAKACGPESEPAAAPDASFPGTLDLEGMPLDLRRTNSWRLRLGEIAPIELAEVLVANALAPAILTSRLEPLLLASPHAQRVVVFVSAVEGQFARHHKPPFHPHTNMAKAALHMLVRTSADDWASRGIALSAVDTGWITDEDPHERRLEKRARGFVPPLDCVDGATRVYDPIRRSLAGEPVHGVFWKDYAPAPW